MHTNTSKFRIRGKYGLFTIPKGILSDNKWAPGDLIGFWGLDGKVIHIEKVCSREKLSTMKKEESSYNKRVYKKIAQFGGGKKDNRTCGIKSLPEFLMKEFKPKDGQMIYFLPAKYTFFIDYYSQPELENIVFATFDPKYLEIYEKSKQSNKKEMKKELMEHFKEIFDLPFFNKSLDTSEKNSDKSKRKVRNKNKLIHESRIFGLECQIKKIKEYKRKVQRSKHPRKNDILKNLDIGPEQVQLEKEKLKKDATPMFKEWTKEEMKKGGTIIRI